MKLTCAPFLSRLIAALALYAALVLLWMHSSPHAAAASTPLASAAPSAAGTN